MLISLSAALFLLVGSTGSSAMLPDQSPAPISDPAPQTPAAVMEVEAAVALGRTLLDEQLTDYPSARFRNVSVREAHLRYRADQPLVRVILFCGQINMRNRMGGMTGWQQFALKANRRGYELDTLSDTTFVQSISYCDEAVAIDQTDYAPALTSD